MQMPFKWECSERNHHPEHQQLSELCKSLNLNESEDKSGHCIWRKSVGSEVKNARRHDRVHRKASGLGGSPRPRARKAKAFGKTISATKKWRTALRRY